MIQIAPKTKIICNGKEFFCSVAGKDERGYTVIDWLLDMFRSVLPPGSSGTINCSETTKQQIFEAYADWNLYLHDNQKSQVRDMRVAIYQKYNTIMLNGIRAFFIDVDTEDITVIEVERSEHEKMAADFGAVNSL